MERRGATDSGKADFVSARSKQRDILELAIPYALILLVCWTPRPWQRLLWVVAAASIVAITYVSYDGRKAMGLRATNFFRSLWVVGAALAAAAVAVIVAARLHTLNVPFSFFIFVKTYWGYALWTAVQQFLLQCFFLARLRRLLPGERLAAAMAALIFALAHLPSPILASVTLLWGFAACLLFLRYRNLYTLAIAHAILGITIAITIPGPVVHNMRVGLGYLTYGHSHRPVQSP
jgi:membrane protease YdiL (CAAX protease family)